MFSKRTRIESFGIVVVAFVTAASMMSTTSARADSGQNNVEIQLPFDAIQADGLRQTRLEIQAHLNRIAAIRKQILEARITRGGLLVLTVPATYLSVWKGFAARARLRKLLPFHPNQTALRKMAANEIEKIEIEAVKIALFGASSSFFVLAPRMVIQELERALGLEEAELNSALNALKLLKEK